MNDISKYLSMVYEADWEAVRNSKSLVSLIKALRAPTPNHKSNNPNAKYAMDWNKIRKKYENAYSVSLTEVPEDKFTADRTSDLILADAKAWLMKIKSDPEIRDEISKDIEHYFREPLNTTADKILQNSYIRGYSQDFPGIVVGHGDQEENTLIVRNICSSLEIMINLKWKNYIDGVDCGDGDEGCLYFSVKV